MESLASSGDNEHVVPDALRDDPVIAARGLQLLAVLGSGGHSLVYRAHDARHARDVAIKVLRETARNDAAVQRFDQEIRVAARLRHPHILPLFDSGTLADGRRFAVMPVAHGRPLRAMIAEGPLALADALRLAREIGEALAFLHANGWLHRDVKPENVLVESGHAVLTDFGIAAPLQRVGASSTAAHVARLWNGDGLQLPATDGAMGTLAYMCPEMLLGDAPLDARVDVYALGLVLYEMLAGELPFGATTASALLAERLTHPLPSLGALRPDVPPAVDAIIARATNVKVLERTPGVAEFRAALDGVEMRTRDERVELTYRDRDRRTVVVAIILLMAIGGSLGILRARTARMLDPHRVMVADLANETGDTTLTRVGVLAGDLITSALSEGTDLEIVNATVALGSRQRPHLPPADSTLAPSTRALVSRVRAGLLVSGAYYVDHGTLELLAEVTDTRGGRIVGAVGPIAAERGAPEGALRALAARIVTIVRNRHAPPT